MLKKLFKQRSAKKIAANYSNYAEFARNASKSEKEVIIVEAIKKANQLQKQVAS